MHATGREKAGPYGLSKVGQQFMAGMMALSRELAVFVAPFINSYKRYASLSWAPVNVVWGRDNRTTGFRLVGRGPALHVENRFPGGDMNAYLTYAAMIGAGLYGIEHGLKLEPEFKGNGYLATGHPRMPRALYEAIAELERSEAARRDLRPGRRRPLPQRRARRAGDVRLGGPSVGPRALSRARLTVTITRAHDRRAEPSVDEAACRAGRRRVQDALYRIADAASAAEDLHAFYATIHGIVGELMYARNFYIALYDDERQSDQLPVLRRRRRHGHPRPAALGAVRRRQCPGTDRLRPAHRPARAVHSSSAGRTSSTAARSRPIGETGRATGSAPRSAPTTASSASSSSRRTTAGEHYSEQDRRRPRVRRPAHRVGADPRTGHRGDPPAQRRAGPHQRDRPRARQAARLRRRSSSSSASACGRSSTRRSMFIAHRTTTRREHDHLPVRASTRASAFQIASACQLGPGLTSIVIRTREPLRLAIGRRGRGRRSHPDRRRGHRSPGSACRSWPASGSSACIGLEASRPMRSTTPTSGSQHARLEHGRGARERPAVRRDQAPAGRDRSSAPPSWRSSTTIGSGLAEQLDFAGDHRARRRHGSRRSSRRRSSYIGLYDVDDRRSIRFPYDDRARASASRTSRVDLRTGARPRSSSGRRCRSRRPDRTTTAEAPGAIQVASRRTESWLGVPIMAGERVLGVIALREPRPHGRVQRGRRATAEHARRRAWASRSRTPACSTRRSACSPRPTSAPPSWRSSTASSRASPRELDMQAMYDLVGDKIQEIFDAQVVDIGDLRSRG